MITDNADNFPTSNWLVTIIVPAESEPNEEWGFRLPRTQSAPQEGCSPFLDRQLSSPHLSPGGPAPPPQIFNNQYGTGINQSAQRAWTII